MAVTSPGIERANPLSMHVVSKLRRTPRTGPETPSRASSIDRTGKGKAAVNGEEPHDSSSGEETVLEPVEAIRQQFQVSKQFSRQAGAKGI